jgi:galactokinase
MQLSALQYVFKERFGKTPRFFYAPGRVNVIGEHTDYNDGFVLPCAIDLGTTVAAARRDDRRIVVYSMDFDETAEFDLNADGQPPRGIWLDYVEGVARSLEKERMILQGADLVVRTTVPIGAGLSSSAALEIAVSLAFLSLASLNMDPRAIALAARQAEHLFVGTKSGIMDQYVAVFGRQDHCLLLDCRSLDCRQIPVDRSKGVFVVCDTTVKHTLASSEYNIRREECMQGVRILRAYLPGIAALRDVTPEALTEYEHHLPERIRRRCRHVVSEIARTLQAADAMSAGRLDELGRLMAASHESLRDDYEVSCFELDVLVDAARARAGVFGARMTGGGFGGSTINLVKPEYSEEFTREITLEYRRLTGKEPLVHTVTPSAGARELVVEG